VIKLLWSRHDETGAGRHTFGAPALFILFAVYVPLACWTAGSIVPTGLIVPVLLIGATIGRLCGLLAVLIVMQNKVGADQDCDAPNATEDPGCGWNWVDPGAFAIYGSAAFFGGISRLHLTIPVIFMEITGQVRLLLPIMLACKVAAVVADHLHPHSLFHAIIEFKGLTFLGAEAPTDRVAELDRQMIKQILIGEPTTLCSSKATIGSVVAVLEKGVESGRFNNDVTYPVVDGENRFEGTISLVQVLKLIEATLSGSELQHRQLERAEILQRSKTKQNVVADTESIIEKAKSKAGALDTLISLAPVVNTSGFTCRDNMSILRAYSLFRTMGCRTMVVTDIGNQVVGMLTRHDLVDVCHPPHDEHHEAHPPPTTPQGNGNRTAPLLSNAH